jgi:acyl-CoA synthetase (AMP-forming)/AMP-acid ligase II
VSLLELFSPTFSNRANQVALEWACQEYTFADLDRRANRMAGALTARGLTRGDRLALYLPNRLEYIDLFLAATRLGVIVVPITCSTANASWDTSSVMRRRRQW